MSQCWQFVPEERPTFTELVTWTENMLKNSGDYLDLSPNLVNNVTYLQPLFLPGTLYFIAVRHMVRMCNFWTNKKLNSCFTN